MSKSVRLRVSFFQKISLLHLASIFGLLTFGLLQSIQAQPQTFAQFTQQDAANGFIFTNNGGGSAALSTPLSSTRITFRYLGISALNSSLQGDQCADIFMDANTNDPAFLGVPPNGYNQPFDTVIVQILRCTPAPVGSNTRRNLLTVTVTTGSPALSGNLGAESASFFASTPTQNVTFTSDFLTFANTTERNFALSFSSITPALSLAPNGFFNSFTAAGTGTFASNPRPVIIAPTAASVSISGRVITPWALGSTSALVTLTDSIGNSRTAFTGRAGRFYFNDVPAGETYILSVRSKRYQYAPQIITVTEDMTELNFSPQ